MLGMPADIGPVDLPGNPHVKGCADGKFAEIEDLPVSLGFLAAGIRLQLVERHGLEPAVAQVQFRALQRYVRDDGYLGRKYQSAPHMGGELRAIYAAALATV